MILPSFPSHATFFHLLRHLFPATSELESVIPFQNKMRRWNCCVDCKEQGLGLSDDDYKNKYNHIDGEDNSVDVGQVPGYPSGPPYYKTIRYKAFVEPAPSHDPNQPCFAAYLATYPVSVDFDDDDKPPAHRRPLFGTRIYDVTPQAGNADRIRDLALRILAATHLTLHQAGNGPYYDRFEVIGMPLDSQHLSDREKVRICADYDEKERELRMATGDKGFYMPLRILDDLYRRGLVMIDRLDVNSDWEDHLLTDGRAEETKAVFKADPEQSRYGTFCVAYWQPRTKGWEDMEEAVPPADDVCLHGRTKYPFQLFALLLEHPDYSRQGIDKFYEHFVSDGRLDQELQRAKEAAQQHGVREGLAQLYLVE